MWVWWWRAASRTLLPSCHIINSRLVNLAIEFSDLFNYMSLLNLTHRFIITPYNSECDVCVFVVVSSLFAGCMQMQSVCILTLNKSKVILFPWLFAISPLIVFTIFAFLLWFTILAIYQTPFAVSLQQMLERKTHKHTHHPIDFNWHWKVTNCCLRRLRFNESGKKIAIHIQSVRHNNKNKIVHIQWSSFRLKSQSAGFVQFDWRIWLVVGETT